MEAKASNTGHSSLLENLAALYSGVGSKGLGKEHAKSKYSTQQLRSKA
jgi:hypothetical protein